MRYLTDDDLRKLTLAEAATPPGVADARAEAGAP
jgi:hypothetical protein